MEVQATVFLYSILIYASRTSCRFSSRAEAGPIGDVAMRRDIRTSVAAPMIGGNRRSWMTPN
ncbi:hypothetical protein PATSB16_22760 [Pandoraea thiooxydans]|nr:hypothetical protein PATSB16_22760 [Pandoraea thiooxydans]